MNWVTALLSRLVGASEWRDIATAPFDSAIELAVIDGDIGVLGYPCLRHGMHGSTRKHCGRCQWPRRIGATCNPLFFRSAAADACRDRAAQSVPTRRTVDEKGDRILSAAIAARRFAKARRLDHSHCLGRDRHCAMDPGVMDLAGRSMIRPAHRRQSPARPRRRDRHTGRF